MVGGWGGGDSPLSGEWGRSLVVGDSSSNNAPVSGQCILGAWVNGEGEM